MTENGGQFLCVNCWILATFVEKLMMETHIVFYYKDGKTTSTYIRNLRPGNVLVGGSGEVLTLVCKDAYNFMFLGENNHKYEKCKDDWISGPSHTKRKDSQQQHNYIML